MPSNAATIVVSVDECEDRLQQDLLQLAAERADAGQPPLSVAEIARLHAAREDVGAAYRGEGPDDDAGPEGGLLPREVAFGNTVLRSPTMAGRLLLDLPFEAKWPVSVDWYDRFTAYVLAHGHDEAALRRVATRDGADHVLREWALCLTATTDQLRVAIRRLTAGTLPAGAGAGADPAKKKHATPPPSAS